MSFRVENHYDLRKHLHVDHDMIFYEEWKSHVINVIQSQRPIRLEKTLAHWPWHDFLWRARKIMWWMSFKVEDHYNLRNHLHIDHNMIFYEEQKSSSDECHSKLRTITTWENTFRLTITWLFMKSKKVQVINVIQSWGPLQLEKPLAHWP